MYYLASDKLEGRAPCTEGEKLAREYIVDFFKKYHLAPKGEDGYFQKFTYKKSDNPHDTSHTEGVDKCGTNVIGFLDNHAPNTIIIGAHYDHLGTDGGGNSLDPHPQGKIHNGADDNASGTAGVLELARYFSSNKQKEKYNMLFICFSGEEDGLIGSKYFTNHPTIALNDVDCMINMDMIGRLNDSTKALVVYGVGTSPEFSDLFKTHPGYFNVTIDSSGVGPSDHTSFYLKKIPVLMFFTGQHKDYHRPSDDADKINYGGMQKVLSYVADVVEKIDDEPKLAFTPTKQTDQQRVSFKVTLGIMPDYSYQGKGLKVDAVNDGKPGKLAGLKEGDIIVAFGDEEIKGIYDYMKQLSKQAMRWK